MAKHHGKRFRVCINDKHFSAHTREFNVTRPIDTADASSFASEYKEVIVGLADGGLSINGYFDGTEDGIDEALSAAIGSATPAVVMGGPAGFGTVGGVVFSALALESTYDITGSIGDVVGVSANFQSDEKGVRSAINLHAGETNGDPGDETASGTSTTVDSGATGITTGGYAAYLSVVANTRNAGATFKIEHSTNGSTWADLATFTAVGAGLTASQRVTGSGTVNRYLRGSWTLSAGTGAVAFALAVARL